MDLQKDKIVIGNYGQKGESMRIQERFLAVVSAVLFVACAAASGYAQSAKPGPALPRYARIAPVDITKVHPLVPGAVLEVRPVTPSEGAGTRTESGVTANAATTTGAGGNIFGLVTVPTFVGAFAPGAGPSLGNVYPFIMMGNDPLVGGTTTIPAKITEVSLTLLNGDGTTNTTIPFAPFEDATTDSPNFLNALYDSSSTATQFGDAVQRAEFFHTGKSSWHTKLGGPTIVNHATLTIPFSVSVTFPDGQTKVVRTWFTGTAADGSTFVLLLDLLFNQDYFNLVVNDITANNFTTDALNMDLLPNTFLFSANEANPNTPGGCCVLGFHTYFYEAGPTPQPRWIALFASWISPGIFGGGFQDVTGLSHEISESFNDPFLSNATPVWQFPNQPPTSTVCQGNLETGDPVEVLPAATVPITIKEGTSETFLFHPQTEALLEWFEMGATSNAVDGAFSYPDETALTKSAVPCP
jgi:hypothetical protein